MAGWGTSSYEPLLTLSIGSPHVQAIALKEVSLLSINEAEALIKQIPTSPNYGQQQEQQRRWRQRQQQQQQQQQQQKQQTLDTVIARFEDRNGKVLNRLQSAETYLETTARVRADVSRNNNILFTKSSIGPASLRHPLPPS